MLILSLIALLSLQAQLPAVPRDTLAPRAPQPAVLEGRVVADAGGEPLRNVRVTLARADQDESDPVLTDGAGRFRFTDLTPGRYVLRARKPGFATCRFGARRALDPAITLDLVAGARVRAIEVRLVRGAAISGRVLDDLGEPVVGAAIRASQIVRSGTGSRPVTVRVTQTDDLGEYRLAGLPPGTYVVSGKPVEFGPGMALSMVGAGMVTGEPTYSQVYFPSAGTPEQARPIALSAGQEVTSTDLVLRQIRRPKLIATVIDASGQPVGGRYMLASINETPGSYLRGGTFKAGEEISTEIDPGESVLQVTGDHTQAIFRFTAGEDDVVTTVMLTKGAKLSGRIVFDGASPPAASSVILTAGPKGAPPMIGSSVARAKGDGTFVLEGLHGPVEIAVRNLPSGWTPRSLTIGGRDAFDGEIDFRGTEQITDAVLTIGKQDSRVVFLVTDAGGAPAGASEIVVFPVDPALETAERRLSLVRTDSAGRATIDRLLPGAYLAIALPDVDERQWAAPDYLDTLRANATRIAIAAGEHKEVALTLRRVP